ncbi:ADM-like [Hippoglossus hippoglossus]|uniref:ADM-like n=1 Tax=Hippoglossus hippoglossus TaxID=8267 RepID=UPI00148C58AF|nr:ADM-like [Hippoglossus hippoglossus]XP_035012940.1 pro-adrenomedullin [Hippoglossus stenolepis]
MRLALHTIICCCVFTTVLPLVKDATEELNTSLKKRFKVWSRAKRDLGNSLVTANEQDSDIRVGLQQGESANTASTQLSSGLNGRPRRSASSKPSGCVLVTCVYHDLLHRLHKIKNSQRDTNAPENKIGSKGYGRRRRSLLYVTQLALQVGRRRRATEAEQQVCRYNNVCTVA